ncbi:reverse transcriptase domain-containing protein [Tanacetum coccineum]
MAGRGFWVKLGKKGLGVTGCMFGELAIMAPHGYTPHCIHGPCVVLVLGTWQFQSPRVIIPISPLVLMVCKLGDLAALPLRVYLSQNGSFHPYEPTRLQDAIRIANNLMDQKLKGYAARNAENKRRPYTIGNSGKKGYAGSFPYCNKFKLHHEGQRTVKCMNCKKVGHMARDCRTVVTAIAQRALVGNQRVVTCFGCGGQGHHKSDCPKLKNQNRGNKAANNETRGRAYALGGGDGNPDSNVVTGLDRLDLIRRIIGPWGMLEVRDNPRLASRASRLCALTRIGRGNASFIHKLYGVQRGVFCKLVRIRPIGIIIVLSDKEIAIRKSVWNVSGALHSTKGMPTTRRKVPFLKGQVCLSGVACFKLSVIQNYSASRDKFEWNQFILIIADDGYASFLGVFQPSFLITSGFLGFTFTDFAQMVRKSFPLEICEYKSEEQGSNNRSNIGLRIWITRLNLNNRRLDVFGASVIRGSIVSFGTSRIDYLTFGLDGNNTSGRRRKTKEVEFDLRQSEVDNQNCWLNWPQRHWGHILLDIVMGKCCSISGSGQNFDNE